MQDAKVLQDEKRAAEKAAATEKAPQQRKARTARPSAAQRTLTTGRRGRPVSLAVDVRVPNVAVATALLTFAMAQIAAVEKQYTEKAANVKDADYRAFCKLQAEKATADWRDTIAQIRAAIAETQEKAKAYSA